MRKLTSFGNLNDVFAIRLRDASEMVRIAKAHYYPANPFEPLGFYFPQHCNVMLRNIA